VWSGVPLFDGSGSAKYGYAGTAATLAMHATGDSANMKTFSAAFILGASLVAIAANAQAALNPNYPEPPQRSIPTGTARDGFFIHDSVVYMVRNGVTTRVDREILIPNGVRVEPNGTVTLRNGRERTLLPKQWLTFDGTLDDFTLRAGHPAVSAAVKRESGISFRDGITVSGADVFITRNSITNKVTSEIHLPNGTVVKPDGSVILSNGNKMTLRVDQFLDLHGVLHDASVVPKSAAGVAPSSRVAK
jgi:hypothetical protein